MLDLEGRVTTLESREVDGIDEVRSELRALRSAMADGFRTLESEIEDVSQLGERDGFGLGMGVVVERRRRPSSEEESQRLPAAETALPGLVASSSSSPSASSSTSTSSHAQAPKTPSPSLDAGAFPVDTTPLAVSSKPVLFTGRRGDDDGPPLAPVPSGHDGGLTLQGGSPVPPRKRYTALLAARSPSSSAAATSESGATSSSSSSSSTSAPISSSPATPEATVLSLSPTDLQPQSHSTPLPSAPFPSRAPTAASSAGPLPTSTRPLSVFNRARDSPGPADSPSSSAAAAAADSPSRRRARSVGASLAGGGGGGGGPTAQAEVEGRKPNLADELKANNRGRAPVNKLISAWERK